ncbi:MAG: type II toxin-antitoxin system ParD family antitoxin [Candidatus Scalindua sp. AMX11]|nr:MAG: type II toxin-antitoxin system ParD family antitoxin [Candidatus Scalindua sp.]NOG85158.1 type II toxin-antitoxin system ParD family antitoxin [Planctomycetota bacterium]RZV67638.1 MAG: type II toxin-antitoxin system ParD family antitoxin [Candidatus Scalindua sp. SCAELEC01]TDE63691.1 MAG: type II toxin-antitoxin system ParD family antitoxin [Candidatus Scalindua sp. AMX11]GJQ57230.1 MAG: addiction module antitoxin [Candidatus Scalindua sp.]
MSFAIGDHFNEFIRKQVKAGRYNNASEVVREGLRLVEEREAKLKALRKHIGTAIKRGGSHSDDEIGEALANDKGQ